MDDEYDYALEYFYEQARNTGYAIANMYRNTVSLIEDKISEYIIDNIAKNFYAENAVDCMKAFALNVKSTSDDVAQVFVNLRNQLQSVVNNYEWQKGSDRHLTVAYIQYKPISVSADNVKSVDNEGNRYIKKDLSIDVEDWIHDCKTEIKSGIRTLSYNVPTDLYIGGGQSYAVRYALNQVAGIIDDLFAFLSYGENSIYNKISEFEINYNKTANNNSENTSRYD